MAAGAALPSDQAVPQTGAVAEKDPVDSAPPGVKEPRDMTVVERSAFAAKCEGIGNRGFQAEDWAYAIHAYEEGIRYLQFQPCDKARFLHKREDDQSLMRPPYDQSFYYLLFKIYLDFKITRQD